MKFDFTKYKAFTVAELMVMLAVLTVMLAAFAPVFTVRYNNASSENVWNFVADSTEHDAYYDELSKSLTAQAFIGISPASKQEAINAVKSGTNALYSKLVIRPTDIPIKGELQKQIQFRYGSGTTVGSVVGALFAGNGNMLLGGNYANIASSAQNNSSFGIGSLNSLSSGSRNTALGYDALNKLTTGSDNTAIGYRSQSKVTSSNYNTTATINSSSWTSGTDANTVIGHFPTSSNTQNSTIVALNSSSLNNATYDHYNVAVGYNALKGGGASNNTAVGFNSGGNGAVSIGSNNTLIGYNSGVGLDSSSSYKTCIGANSCNSVNSGNGFNLLKDSTSRVYIGGKPVDSSLGGVAVLEVHNYGTNNSSLKPMARGNESVLINGNLVVRGQSFFQIKGNHSINSRADNSLVGFRELRPRDTDHTHSFSGWDGTRRDIVYDEYCNNKCRRHDANHGFSSCRCTTGNVNSYDWNSLSNGDPIGYNCMKVGSTQPHGKSYTDLSIGGTVIQDKNDINLAHPLSGYTNSCCPDIRTTSDLRLKNVGLPFDDDLAAVLRLNPYNFIFKSDSNKTPQVGVIAQDLKTIFPNAVERDSNGYLHIRWDEMFYATINSVKTLNRKIENLAARIKNNQAKIAALKKDNAELIKKLDSLENELNTINKK